jgi:hypothetical protein
MSHQQHEKSHHHAAFHYEQPPRAATTRPVWLSTMSDIPNTKNVTAGDQENNPTGPTWVWTTAATERTPRPIAHQQTPLRSGSRG